ncbi:MAG: PaaI family thioesterase [Phototrophicaceae bacterium]
MASKQEIIAFLQRDFPQFSATIDAVEPQSATVRHHVTQSDLRPGGTISGPTLFALADSALYVAILGEIGIIALAVTTHMSINFLRKPSANADIIAICQLVKVGKTLIVGEVKLYSEGDPQPIAHAVGTYAIPPKKYQKIADAD